MVYEDEDYVASEEPTCESCHRRPVTRIKAIVPIDDFDESDWERFAKGMLPKINIDNMRAVQLLCDGCEGY